MKKFFLSAVALLLGLTAAGSFFAMAATGYGDRLETDDVHAAQMTVTAVGDGVFNLRETQPSGISIFVTQPVLPEEGAVTAEIALHFNALPWNAPDKWMAVMISQTEGIKRPENPALAADVGLLLRTEGQSRVSVSVSEAFENASAASGEGFLQNEVGMTDRSLRIRIAADTEKTDFIFNGDLIYRTESFTAGDYTSGMFLSLCTHSTGDPQTEGGYFDFDLSLDGNPLAGDAVAFEDGREEVSVPVKCFGYAFEGVYDGETPLEAELSASGEEVLIDPAAFAGLSIGESKTLTLCTAGGEAAFRVEVVDSSSVQFAEESATFEKFSEEDLRIPFEMSGLTDLTLTLDGEAFSQYEITEGELILEAEELSELAYGPHELVFSGRQIYGGGISSDSIILYVERQTRSYVIGSGEDPSFTLPAGLVPEAVESSVGVLEPETDYALSEGRLRISASWLEAHAFPRITLFLLVSGEVRAEIAVLIEDGRAPEVTGLRSAFDKKVANDLTAEFEPYGGKLRSVELDGEKLDGSRWILTGTEFTLSGAWLIRIDNGTHRVILTTEYGECSFEFTVQDSREPVASAQVLIFDSNEAESFSLEFRSYAGDPRFLLDGEDISSLVEVEGKTVTIGKEAFSGLLSGTKMLSIRDSNGVCNVEIRYTRDWQEDHSWAIVLAAVLPVLLLIGAGVLLGTALRRRRG